MCGIGAILRTDGGTIPEAWLDLIDTRITPRGPDGCGRFKDRARPPHPDRHPDKRTYVVALVHRRLSIIDHEDGDQPMVSLKGRTQKGRTQKGRGRAGQTEGKVAVVFNGCIYNHRELRSELEARGHRFTTDHSDTEVLIHGHREWGPGLQHHLEGMYAYAIWDRAAGNLMLGRDWFGEKPLYVWRGRIGDGNIVVAASDAKAVGQVRALAAPEANPGPTFEWTEGYLQLGYGYRGTTGYGCARDGGPAVRTVPPSLPGHLQSPEAPPPGTAQPKAFVELIESCIERAVERRLEADVPLGCFLSGGVDSSLLAVFARRYKPNLHTFSVRMPDPRYDESMHAERIASELGTTHTTLEVAARPAEDTLRLIQRLGQPFADSSILPTYWVSKAARQHVKVAISGDGADELFLGYERYLAARTLDRWSPLLRFLPRGTGAAAHPKSLRSKVGRLGHMARDRKRFGVLAMESIFTRDQIESLLGAATDTPPHFAAGPDARAALRAADVRGYLPGDLLTKVDTASMAVALEVRCPYLDRDLAQAVLTAPLEWLTPGDQRKGLLRQIARKHLPAEVIDRPKMGFAIPIDQWFRTDHGGMKALLMDQLKTHNPFGPIAVNRKALRQIINDHMERRRDHGHRLFALLTLSIWAKSL